MKRKARRQKRAGRAPLLPRLGGELGRVAGTAAQYFFDKITGRGEYKVRSNELLTDTGPPQFLNSGDGLVVSHREFIADIAGNPTFLIQLREAVNPGNERLNPWLAGVARMFEEWEALGWIFSLKPTTGMAVASTNASMGVIVMATDYDVLNGPFASRQEMEAYEYSTSAVSYQPQTHPVECQPRQNVMRNLFVRSAGEAPTGSDARFYDLGNFTIAVDAQQSTNKVVEAWGAYKVRLRKPRLPLYATPSYDHFVASPAGSAAFGSVGGTSGWSISVRSNLSGILSATIVEGAPSSGIYLTRPGTFLVLIWSGGVGMTTAPGVSVGANITATIPWFANYTSGSVQVVQTTISQGFYAIVMNVNTPGFTAANKFTANGCVGLSAGNGDVFVFPLPTTTAGLGLEAKIMSILQKMNVHDPMSSWVLSEEKSALSGSSVFSG